MQQGSARGRAAFRIRVALIGGAVVASMFAVVLPAQPAGAALVPNMQNVVLFVHGYNPTSTSTNCQDTFGNMMNQMRAQGFTGAFVRVGYYSGDTNCDVNLHSYASYGDRDSWKSIAGAFSKYVYNTYTSRGVTVDVVGYSMGGLIVRGAVWGSQSGASGFSSRINVSDGVTLGGPHNGAAWYSNLCLWGQCSSMVPGSSDLNWLNQNGNPQGAVGTTWTTIGSFNDDVVPWQSAIYMSISTDHKVVFANVSHTGFIHPNYMNAWAVVNRAGNALGTVPGKVTSGVSTGKCVDVRQSGTANGTAVQLYDCNGTGAQVWTHSLNGKTILTALGKCLDVTGGSSSAGTKVELWDCNTGSNQEWTIGADHTLKSLGMCLDDPGSTTNNSTQLQIWTCNGTNAQKWYFG
jgi:Ricin-type beta-trefoil lectin domain